jgi:wyosine [tRNA(Phe)-imidazoG37] synthetase (radical SAM superfamily)
VTFVGSGETTLHSGLGWLIRQIGQITSLPIAVITNGSLLYLPEVRGELLAADSVLPSLDAGNASLYRRINRPWRRLTFERLVSGLDAFR